MKRSNLVPFNLQFFAEPAGGEGTGSQAGQSAGAGNAQNVQAQQSAPAFDYDKLANIISGKQTVTEDTVLKNYFKQQGLSQEEMNSAISAFKAEKAKNTPDINALQSQLSASNKALLESKINNQATLEAMSLGLDAKYIPYVIKLADMSNAVDDNGNVNAEEVKKALTQVLTDVPAFKGTAGGNNEGDNNSGGFRVGQSSQQNALDQEDILRGIFGIKK